MNMVFVLKDSNGWYVSGSSLSADSNIYTFSKSLINGFYTYGREQDAKNDLDKLIRLSHSMRLDCDFHIEKINILKTILNEKVGSGIEYLIIHNGKIQVA